MVGAMSANHRQIASATSAMSSTAPSPTPRPLKNPDTESGATMRDAIIPTTDPTTPPSSATNIVK